MAFTATLDCGGRGGWELKDAHGMPGARRCGGGEAGRGGCKSINAPEAAAHCRPAQSEQQPAPGSPSRGWRGPWLAWARRTGAGQVDKYRLPKPLTVKAIFSSSVSCLISVSLLSGLKSSHP